MKKTLVISSLFLLRSIRWSIHAFGTLLEWILFPIRLVAKKILWPLLLVIYRRMVVWGQRWKLFSHSTHRILSVLTHRLSIFVAMISLCSVVLLLNMTDHVIAKRSDRFAAGSLLDTIAAPNTDVILTATMVHTAQGGWIQPGTAIIDMPTIQTGELGESPVVATSAIGVALQASTEITKTERTRTDVETYIVQNGDTAGTIAEKFDLRIETILDANKIADANLIKPGQKLSILPVDGVKHTVAKTDSLKSIAEEYRADVDDILEFNNLKSKKDIPVGEEIIVPDGRIPAPTPVGVTGVASSVLPTVSSTYTGGHIWPTTATLITSHFGYRWGGFHTGTDIAGALGDPVWASAPGTVLVAGWNNGGYGNMVLIDHGNGVQTRYGHLNSISVSYGQVVSQGQEVGKEGTTGWSSGPHLHYECIIGGTPVNPLGNCL